MSLMTVLSRILGLWRDRLMAGIFGASGVNDAFNLAFLLPNLTRRLFGEGALSSVFVPVFSEHLVTNRREHAFRTASILLTRLAVGLFVAGALFVAGSYAVQQVTPLAEQQVLTLQLANSMIFYCVLINLAAVLMGILNAMDHFWTPAFAPVLLNVCMILGCTVFLNVAGSAPEDRIRVQAWSVMAGGVLQVLVLIAPVLVLGFKFTPSLDVGDEGYQAIKRGFLPTILGVALFQINLLLDQLIATAFIPEVGPVTILAYGNRLIQLPWALFSLSLATAALPLLSRYWAEGKKEEFGKMLGVSVRHTLYLAAPSAVGLCLLSTDLSRLFYGTGKFLQENDGEAVHRCGRVVFYFAIGLCFYSLNAVLARAIYATKDTRTPTYAAAVAVAVNLVLNLFFVLGTNMKEAGLALASSISGGVQTLFLVSALYKKLDRPSVGRSVRFAAAMLIGGLASVVLAKLAYAKFGKDPASEEFIAFLVASGAALLALGAAGDLFFALQLQAPTLFTRLLSSAPQELQGPDGLPPRYWVPEDRWTPELRLYHGMYTTAMSCMLMGLMVWSVRDSVPAEGSTFGLIFQRSVVPVAAGVVVYALASGMIRSREYEELKTAFVKKMGTCS